MPRKKKELFSHQVTALKHITGEVYTLSFRRHFNFIPGQVVAVAIHQNDDPRLYSIASGKDEDDMRILFDIKADGFLTPKLKELKVGEEIFISEPFGNFVPSGKDEWWVATGTGIAPFVSMVLSGCDLPQKLIHGSRTLSYFLYQDLLKDRLSVDYMRFCTREEGPDIISGRLTHWLKQQISLPENIKYYLCGNPEMVVDVRDIILSKGIDFENIMAEIYF